MNHEKKAKLVLVRAVSAAVAGNEAASGPYVRERVISCIQTALAMAKEDYAEVYRLIDEARLFSEQERVK